MGDVLDRRASIPALEGRDLELEHVTEMLVRVHQRGAGLVIRGDAGIGKSALLDWSRRAAAVRGMRVLTATGLAPEMKLPFAGLHQLLLPILAGVDALPRAQRDAVQAAFGVAEHAAPEPFLIALGVLNLLEETATSAPLMLTVDDIQWLDDETAGVIAFVARRLEFAPVALLVALRDYEASALDDVGLPELRLGPLGAGSASALLETRAPNLPRAVRARLLQEAEGNPLALVELPIAAVGLDPSDNPPPWLPLTARLERTFASRISDLPPITRATLLAAAVNDGDATWEALAAAGKLLDTVVGVEWLTAAVDDRLVELEGATLRFRHPLIRSAIYHRATAAERRTTRLALAETLSGDADRSISHRAEAAAGPDEAVARGLETAATNARHRGAVPTALAGLERAARLSVDPGGRMRRLLGAAVLAHELGRAATVARLFDVLEDLELTTQDRVRIASRRWAYDGPERLNTAGVLALVGAAELAVADEDVDVALELLVGAACMSWLLGTSWAEGRQRVLAGLHATPHDPSDPRAVLVLAMGAPVERGRDVVEWLRQREPRVLEDAMCLYYLGLAAGAVGAIGFGVPLLQQAVASLRSAGRIGPLCQALGVMARLAFHRGDCRTALVAADECARLAAEASQPHMSIHAQVTRALVDAVGSRVARAEAAANETERGALSVGLSVQLAEVQHLRGLIALGSGRPGEAYDQLRRIFKPGDPAHHPYTETVAVADLVEAAAHAGKLPEIRGVVDRLGDVWAATHSPALQAGLAFARPILATDDRAEAQFTVALDELAEWPLLRARTLLAQGQWLRRQRRVAECRTPLRAAEQALGALDAVGWRDRARQELRASGDNAARPPVRHQLELTPQELQIARMAAGGLSNAEIAQDLFISRRTVSTHLYRIFPKLGITARTELAAALADSSLMRP